MNKNFSKEDILKKHETNVKSAHTAIFFSGVLGLIYIIRFFITGNFNYFFSLSFTDMILRIGKSNGQIILPAIVSVIFAVLYIVFGALGAKKPPLLYAALGVYIFDFICLIVSMVFIFEKPLDQKCFIDLIVHLFVVTFLVVGIVSSKKIKE